MEHENHGKLGNWENSVKSAVCTINWKQSLRVSGARAFINRAFTVMYIFARVFH